MRKLLSVIVSLMTAMTFAQQPVELPLWPDGAPNSNGLTGGEKEVSPHRLSNVTAPTITVYRAPQPNGMAVIMCPGGGYSRLAMDHEGHDMAPWFCGQGITYVVLKYRMPNGHCEVPLSDAERAIRIVREHAGEWNILQVIPFDVVSWFHNVLFAFFFPYFPLFTEHLLKYFT